LNPETTTGDIAYRSATANTNTRLAIGTTGQVLTVAAGVPSWATPTTGDIEGVTAGTGISGGGTSGTVTVTNSMATAIDAKGDLIVGTGADTFSRLAVGTNTYILTADSAEATGLKWAAPSAGGSTFAGCSIKQSSAQSISNNTDTILNFDAEFFDTDAFHDNSTNNSRITIPAGKGGYYLFTLNVRLNGGTSGDFFIKLIKNGSEEQVIAALLNSVTPSSQYSVVAAGAVSDYFQAKVYQASGSTQTIEISQTRFQASFLGA
jgi:hypothetical protein